MFRSVKEYLNKDESRSAEIGKLAAESRQFKLPSETLITVFKWLFFGGLAFLNYRLFAEVVPGAWGVATGIVAMMSEALAIYCSHYFSRAAGLFRAALGLCGSLLIAFSLIHGTFSILDLIGVWEYGESIEFYSRVIAFPLLAALIGLSVIALTMTHPNNLIRLKEALAHTEIAQARAGAASRVRLMQEESIVQDAELAHQRAKTERRAEQIKTLKENVNLELEMRQYVRTIPDRDLQQSLAREMGFAIEAPPTQAEKTGPGFVTSKPTQRIKTDDPRQIFKTDSILD